MRQAFLALTTFATLCVSGKTIVGGVAHECRTSHHLLHQQFEFSASDHGRDWPFNADGASRDVDIGARQAESLEVQAFQGTDGVRRFAASVL